jgi:hypothetical protein
VKVLYPDENGQGTWTTEWLGFIVDLVVKDARGLSTLELAALGTFKFLNMSRVMEDASVAQQYEDGVEISDTGLTPFQNNFSGSALLEVFDIVSQYALGGFRLTSDSISNRLDTINALPAATIRQTPVSLERTLQELQNTPILDNPNVALWAFDPNAFFQLASFQTNFLALATMMMVRARLADNSTWNWPQPLTGDALNDQQRPAFTTAGYTPQLQNAVMGIVEFGNHKAYNEAVKAAFSKFQSKLRVPDSILTEACQQVLFEFFETRSGTLVARPHRFNQLVDDYFRYRTTTGSDAESAKFSLVQDQKNPANYVLNPLADFFIPAGSVVASENSQDDSRLETRVDIQWMNPFTGAIDYITGHYTDPSLLPRYGLRTQGAVTFPVAQSYELASALSVAVLNIANASTNGRSMTVWNDRSYQIGKLYYLEKYNEVGYLMAISTKYTRGSGDASTHTLTFGYVRNVYQKQMECDDELVNAYMMYTDAPLYGTTPPESVAATDNLSKLTQVAKAFWANQLSSVGSCATVPMFRYVPNLLDVLYFVDGRPESALQQSSTSSDVTGKATDEAVKSDTFSVKMPVQLASSLIQLFNGVDQERQQINPGDGPFIFAGGTDDATLAAWKPLWCEYLALLGYASSPATLVSPGQQFPGIEKTVSTSGATATEQIANLFSQAKTPTDPKALSSAASQMSTPILSAPFGSPSIQDSKMKNWLWQRLMQLDLDLKENHFPRVFTAIDAIIANGLYGQTGDETRHMLFPLQRFVQAGVQTPLANTCLMYSVSAGTFVSPMFSLSVDATGAFTLDAPAKVFLIPDSTISSNFQPPVYNLPPGRYRISATTTSLTIFTADGKTTMTVQTSATSSAPASAVGTSLAAGSVAVSPGGDIIGMALTSSDFEFSLDALVVRHGVLRGFMTSQDSVPTTKPGQIELNKGFLNGQVVSLVPAQFLKASDTGLTFTTGTSGFGAKWMALLNKHFAYPTSPSQRLIAQAAQAADGSLLPVYTVGVSDVELGSPPALLVPIP